MILIQWGGELGMCFLGKQEENSDEHVWVEDHWNEERETLGLKKGGDKNLLENVKSVSHRG